MSTHKGSTLSTHVLDTNTGNPAPNLRVILKKVVGENQFELLKEQTTNTDGRAREFPELENGVYQITFMTDDYFKANNITAYFYPKVSIEFIVDTTRHYHVPLLISPYGYSTYRGS
ncbi:hypothetical protein PPL_01862 [Heterostelium album PN500]|uniref:5-hydroxyisourate hydrolase n=1 Tax=Heterostelium pallidum (strain ATCC 26659 / Pp 5 / PN500) TaxID=670386 RepID=D3B0P5_HETP5|nr:hypothetical protein PPL_01862 [Heterostelium album PN500]EFA84869.1 hypothetical protein PPL_01862 [Heterostelium album PN500]|eukprot:XP_020436980.1 hypothetical protein PPL_01862 [Heterostelium album PN500]